jgi:hypothetical protein
VVTRTLLAPALPAGVVAVIVVALVATTLVAATPPIVTPVTGPRPVPVIVILVPPDAEPKEGLTLVTVGAASSDIDKVPKVELQPVVPVW